MKFTKMHGCGNDYIYINCFEESFPTNATVREKLVQQLSDRHFGIGGDGVILICPSEVADARMVMYNADGSSSAMCGNGIRCVAKFVHDHGIARKETLTIETAAGIKTIRVVEKKEGWAVRLQVDMGEPILEPAAIPAHISHGVEEKIALEDRTLKITAVSMGNPHGILFVDEPTDEWVLKIGPRLERHPIFPQRANIEFVQVLSPQEVVMRVWERGTGETLACGTGASAVCVAGVLTGKTERNVLIHLPGGDLDLVWDAESGHVLMTGPATEVFHGEIALSALLS
ncbi:MAG: diaminopimelate epimerase [Planctomycetia bacterium]|nr:diaminopimelate epimerase [Planctomycetia bacterium]